LSWQHSRNLHHDGNSVPFARDFLAMYLKWTQAIEPWTTFCVAQSVRQSSLAWSCQQFYISLLVLHQWMNELSTITSIRVTLALLPHNLHIPHPLIIPVAGHHCLDKDSSMSVADCLDYCNVILCVWCSYLPSHVNKQWSFPNKVFCGTFSQDGNTFLSACQGVCTQRLTYLNSQMLRLHQ